MTQFLKQVPLKRWLSGIAAGLTLALASGSAWAAEAAPAIEPVEASTKPLSEFIVIPVAFLLFFAVLYVLSRLIRGDPYYDEKIAAERGDRLPGFPIPMDGDEPPHHH